METILTIIFIILMVATTVALYIFIYKKYNDARLTKFIETPPVEDSSEEVEECAGDGETSRQTEDEDATAALQNDFDEAVISAVQETVAATQSEEEAKVPAGTLAEKPGHSGFLIVAAFGVFALQLFIFFYGLKFRNLTYLKAFINAETFSWIAAIGFIDFKKKIIPNPLILAGIGFWVITKAVEILLGGTPVKSAVLFSVFGGGLCGIVLFVVSIITRSALGMGDVKLFTVIGLLFGLFDTCSILIITVIVMAIVSIVLLATKKVDKRTKIPMAPFAVAGLLLQVITGV